MKPIQTGLDTLLAELPAHLKGRTLGLVVNQTSVAADGRHSILHFLEQKSVAVKKIFAPEHGLYGVEQDMAPVADQVDPASGLPVVSLYGTDHRSLSPDPALLAGIENLVFDIQDVGSRYYTFIYTLANCMEACRETGARLIVCDRPNPLNGASVEGNRVDEAYRSFVGQYPLCNRHGMTVGELAKMFNDAFGIGCDLEVVRMTGWNRKMWYDQTGRLWVPPSPNMPTVATATVYPGMCLIEGTGLSEGRGTALPFEQIGAPGIEPHRLADRLNAEGLLGVSFRPHFFKPTFHKWAGHVCGGVQLHVTDRNRFKPFLTGLAVLRGIHALAPDRFTWRSEPYEFVSDRPAIDLLYGNSDFRNHLIRSAAPMSDLEASWEKDRNEFLKMRRAYLIY